MAVKVVSTGYRRYIRHLLQELPLARRRRRLQGVEVGVARGEFSAFILHYCSNVHLVMVDPWRTTWPADSRYAQSFDKMARFPPERWAAMRADAESVAAQYPRRATVLPTTSVEAAALFGTLGTRFDFVYLDADHSYEGVREDMRLWADLLNPGGLLCGDEYKRRWYPGATRAVDEFFAAHPTWNFSPGRYHIWHGVKPLPRRR